MKVKARNLKKKLGRQTRREFITNASYAAPALLSLGAAPAFAQQGSTAGSTGGGGDIEPPGNTGPRPASDFLNNCDNPMQPIDSDVAVSVCEITTAPDGSLLFQDVIVSPENVPASIANGSVIDTTCDAFVCSAS